MKHNIKMKNNLFTRKYFIFKINEYYNEAIKKREKKNYFLFFNHIINQIII